MDQGVVQKYVKKITNNTLEHNYYCDFGSLTENHGSRCVGYACLSDFRDSIVASIPACHAGDRGSIPRRGKYPLILPPFALEITPFRPFSHLKVSPTTATSTFCVYVPKTKDLNQHAYTPRVLKILREENL